MALQWDGETTGNDIVTDISFLTGADETTAYPLVDREHNANRALDRIVALILQCDGIWQWDDTSLSTELLDVTTNLAASTQKYILSVAWLKIAKVRIKDSAGNWITLKPVNRRDLTDAELTASAGTPSKYDILGNYIYLHPKPSYASTGGLEVQFQRGPTYFVSTDTTKTPGFASQFHRLISLYAALDYCDINDLDKRAAKIQKRIDKMEADLIAHYSSRDADSKVSFKVPLEDYGQSSL